MNVVEAVRSAWIREAEEALTDAPDYVTYEDWSRAWHLRERLAEMLLAERLREPREPIHRVDAPPMPATVSDPTGAVREGWAAFHSAPRPPREPSPIPVRHRPKPSRMRPGSEDISSWPEGLLP